MSNLIIPNVLVNGTGPANIIDAVALNANFTAIATAVNNIYPSQILPITTAQATFGATATGIGYKFLANDATATPLTVSGVTSQSANILAVTLTSGGAAVLSVTPAGSVSITTASTTVTPLQVTGAASSSGPTVAVNAGANQSGQGVLINGAAGFTGNLFEIDATLGGTQRLIVSAAGSLIVGAQAPIAFGSALVAGDVAGGRSVSTGAIAFGGATSNGTIDWNIGTGSQISLKTGANVFANFSAGVYTNASDVALKTNIVPISDSLAKITALTPVTFDWIHDGLPGIGFTAQDVQAQFPDAVSMSNDGTLGYAPTAVLAHLVAAFQQYVAAHP